MKRLAAWWQRARAAITAAADLYGRQLTDEDREHIAWAESLRLPPAEPGVGPLPQQRRGGSDG